MCGIAGIIATRENVTHDRLKTIATALGHRGPDDEGIETLTMRHSDQVAGLIHRRLSIIDLSPTGHQPMSDPETGNWIVFNGEIYDYQELKGDLEKRGYRFRSQSDTEVILKAYAAEGEKCVHMLRGMFAFALFDAREQKLFCAVDRFGIKPFYFCHSTHAFTFSSEVRAILKAGVVPPMIDPRAVESFLAYGTVQAPYTIVKGVEALLPGHVLTYDVAKKNVHIAEYWTPKAKDVNERRPFREVLLDSVRHHLISDVPVALFLSGGVDSSALALLVHEVAGRTLDSFSVTFAEQEYAEGQYARRIGEEFCARHHEIRLSDTDLRALLPQALDAMDQPTIDGVNVYVIAKAVHDSGIKVVLSGQGGDEIFGGYSTFKRLPRMQSVYGLLSGVGRHSYHGVARAIRLFDTVRGRSSFVESKLSQFFDSDGSLLSNYLILRQLFGPLAREKILGGKPDGRQQINGLSIDVFDTLQQRAASGDVFSAISLFELRLYLANTLLRDGDVMSMAHGLEVRVPYLDHEIVEAVFGTPIDEKTHPTFPKPLLLRHVIEKIPREIYDRKKMGFTFPWEIWLRGHLRSRTEEVFFSGDDWTSVGIDRDVCRRLWQEFLQKKSGVTWARVWALYVLLYWIRRNIHGAT